MGLAWISKKVGLASGMELVTIRKLFDNYESCNSRNSILLCLIMNHTCSHIFNSPKQNILVGHKELQLYSYYLELIDHDYQYSGIKLLGCRCHQILDQFQAETD